MSEWNGNDHGILICVFIFIFIFIFIIYLFIYLFLFWSSEEILIETQFDLGMITMSVMMIWGFM